MKCSLSLIFECYQTLHAIFLQLHVIVILHSFLLLPPTVTVFKVSDCILCNVLHVRVNCQYKYKPAVHSIIQLPEQITAAMQE